jgi:hypothetical protein
MSLADRVTCRSADKFRCWSYSENSDRLSGVDSSGHKTARGFHNLSLFESYDALQKPAPKTWYAVIEQRATFASLRFTQLFDRFERSR